MSDQQFVQISRRGRLTEDELYALIPALDAKKYQMIRPPQFELEDLSPRIAGNVITSPDAPVPDCQTCGACCVFHLCVAVGAADKRISPEYYWEVTRESERGEIVVDRFMRRDEETMQCTALTGTVGVNVGCGVYEHRPQVCRDFEAGSDKCHGVRRAFGIEPFLSAMEMYEGKQKLKAKEATQTAESNPSETIDYAKIRAQAGTENLEIVAYMEDEAEIVLHIFNPEQESWGQSEFFSRTLEDARSFIQSRSGAAML